MKTYVKLFSIVLTCATTLVGAQTAHAIAGSDWIETSQLQHKKSNLVILVNGRLKGKEDDIHIRFIDYDINSSILQKEALLEAVQYQMLQTDLDGKRYRVIDFDTDARLTDRYGKLYKADADGSVNLGKSDIQEYLLTGHVVLEEVTELTPDQLKNPAADVNMYYNVQFSSMEDEKPFLSEEVDLGRVPVGKTITSSDLKEKAQQLLEKNTQVMLFLIDWLQK